MPRITRLREAIQLKEAILRVITAETDDETKGLSLELLGKISVGGAENISLLLHHLRNGGPWTKIGAAHALGHLGYVAASAIPDLLDALDDQEATEDYSLPEAAAWAIGEIGVANHAVFDALSKCLSYRDINWCGYRAVEAIGKLGTAARVVAPAVEKFLVAEDAPWDAVNTLVRIGVNPVPLLQRIIQSNAHPNAIRQAKRAIDELTI